MKKFTAAAVQMNALKDDLHHNLEVHAGFTEKAAQLGCALILFPELSATAHYGHPDALRFAEEAGSGRIGAFMRGLARKHHIVIGYGFAESARGAFFNTQAFVGPEGLIGIQRKLHASSDEYYVFRMGGAFETFDFGFCKAGCLVCYDGALSECWRVLALRGVEVVLRPSAGRFGGKGKGAEIPLEEQRENIRKKTEAARHSIHAYASENAVFVVAGNQAGYNGHSTHGGGASISDPFGRPLAIQQPTIDDQMITAELDPGVLAEARNKVGYTLRTRRPELFGEIAEMI